MINLRAELRKILKTLHGKVYYEEATNETDFPYLVYNLPSSFTVEDQEVFVFDIDIWDRSLNGDTTEIEVITNTIWKYLDKFHFINKDMQFTIYRTNRLSIKDDDPSIIRRKLVFQLKYFNREV